MECWGAQGSFNGTLVPLAAYTYGKIYIQKNVVFFVFVGQSGIRSINVENGTFNGGGGYTEPYSDTNNHTGGGATDIRLLGEEWNNFNSLKSRIMVAAGGGGAVSPIYITGYGGGLTSNMAEYGDERRQHFQINGVGQTYGYKFGIGETNIRAGGGGGYYGGYAEQYIGSGGSSFISGHTGCNAISSASTSTNIVHTGQPNHYSGYVFTNTVMKAGNELMPSPTGGTETGHSGNGYCKITWHPSL